jgi:hypothetical protein
VNSNKRAAQSKVVSVRMMVPALGQEGEEKYPQSSSGLLDIYWSLI